MSYLRQIIFIIGDDRSRVPFLILIFIASSLLDIAGLGIIFPYVSLILDPESNLGPFTLRFLSLFGGDMKNSQIILIIGAFLVLVFLLKVCFSLFVNWVILNFSYIKGAKLRTTLMDKYQNISYGE